MLEINELLVFRKLRLVFVLLEEAAFVEAPPFVVFSARLSELFSLLLIRVMLLPVPVPVTIPECIWLAVVLGLSNAVCELFN